MFEKSLKERNREIYKRYRNGMKMAAIEREMKLGRGVVYTVIKKYKERDRIASIKNPTLKEELMQMGASSRVVTCLSSFENWQELRDMSPAQFLRIPNLGRKTCREIFAILGRGDEYV